MYGSERWPLASKDSQTICGQNVWIMPVVLPPKSTWVRFGIPHNTTQTVELWITKMWNVRKLTNFCRTEILMTNYYGCNTEASSSYKQQPALNARPVQWNSSLRVYRHTIYQKHICAYQLCCMTVMERACFINLGPKRRRQQANKTLKCTAEENHIEPH